jgi:hypothetical protein
VDATAAEDFCVHFLAIVADLASSVVTVDRSNWGAVVASTDDLVVFDDDGSYCFLEASSPFLEDKADVEKVLIVARSELSDDVLVVF